MGRPVQPVPDDIRPASGRGVNSPRSTKPDGLGAAFPDDVFDLACPSCGSDLTVDELFLVFRVCQCCHRHFSIPARERIGSFVDPSSLHEFGVDTSARTFDTMVPGAERLSQHHDLRVLGDAVVTGTARIGGAETVIVALDDHLVGASLGALMVEKIIVAFEFARTQHCPVVILCAGGSARTQAGPLAVVQSGRLAASAARLHMDGVPLIAVVTHPTSAWIFSALVSQCDLVFAEPGARVGIEATAADGLPGLRSRPAEMLLADGWVDEIVDRTALRGKLSTLFDLLAFRGIVRAGPHVPTTEVAGPASWQALTALRHPDRPDAGFYVPTLVSSLTLLTGDRVEGEDPGTICGLGRFDSVTIAVAVLNHLHPSGEERSESIAARKIMRLAKLAGRLELSLLILVDGGRPRCSLAPTVESAQAVASLAGVLAMLPVPVVSIAIGEVSGSLATSLMSVDRQFMQENAILASTATVPGVSPERSSPVHHPTDRPERGSILTARESMRLGLIDDVIAEPGEGAHTNPDDAAAAMRAALQHALAELAGTGQRRLLDTRHQRQRSLGQSTPAGLAAARSELWDLQEWQQSLTRSIDDWRERWGQRRGTAPRIALHRPDLGDIAGRLRARRSGLLERAGRGDRAGL